MINRLIERFVGELKCIDRSNSGTISDDSHFISLASMVFHIPDIAEYPITKWRSSKERISMLSPERKFDLIHNITTMFLKIVGCSVTERNFKKSILTGVAGYIILNIYVLSAHSTYYYKHDFTLAVESIVVIGLTIPVSRSQILV